MPDGIETKEKDFRIGLTHKKSLAIAGYLGALIAIWSAAVSVLIPIANTKEFTWGGILVVASLWIITGEATILTGVFICKQHQIDIQKAKNGEKKI